MAHFHNPSIIGASGNQSLSYNISRSLRFNSADSAYLSRTPASAGNQQTWTLSMWVKRGKLGSTYRLFDAYTAQTDTGYTLLGFSNEDKLIISGWNNNWKITTQVFRDVSAWYHLVVAFDVTQSTGTNRIKFYVNGTQITAFDTDVAPAQNTNHAINGAFAHAIGRYSPGPSQYFDGYLADVIFVDGQALTPSSFTKTDATTGQLGTKTYLGSYGNNGFNLLFSDNSSTAALGTDSSGKNNTWTVNNFSVTNTAIYSGLASGTFDQGYYKPSNMWTAAGTSNTSNVQTAGTTSSSGSYGTSVYFDLSSKPISATSAQLWILKDNNIGNYAPKIEINGTDITPSVLTTGYSWVGVTGITSVTSIRIPAGAYCGGIRINGVVFTEGQTTDSLTDSPTNYGTDDGLGGNVRGNYCTLNPLFAIASLTLVNGNLETSSPGAAWRNAKGTFAMTTGKWYWEHTVPTTGASDGYIGGVATATADYSSSSTGIWGRQGTTKYSNGSSSTPFGSTTSGDILGFAFDADAGKLWVAQNGTWVGDPGAGTGESWSSIPSGVFPYVAAYNQANVVNFGQRAFAYTNNRSGFKALCTQNLPQPTGVVAQPSTAMDVKLYTGNGGSSQTVTGLGFSPDLVWFKARSSAYNNGVFDSVRGVQNRLHTNLTDAEDASPTGLTAFNSDGFTFGANNVNGANGVTYAAWCWDAGSSTVTNTQGSITSQVRANASAGFSIVTYTGNGTAGATIGHGLNIAPQLLINKRRSSTGTTADWAVWHKSVADTSGSSYVLFLNTTDNALSASNRFNSTAPTSTVFTVGNSDATNYSGGTFVTYCFAPVAGYSSFGSYTGNGSSDGPFVYTGFRPRWILMKQSVAGEAWTMYDTARDTYNVAGLTLFANYSNAETDYKSYTPLDILSNGFKLRTSNITWNTNGATVIYAAFAESPFAYARAR